MTPDREGIWEWFEEDGTKRLMAVYDVAKDLRKVNGTEPPYFRAYWWGGYYNVTAIGEGPFEECEWPERWGNFVGEHGSIPDEQLYLMPTPEQREKILKQYEDQSARN